MGAIIDALTRPWPQSSPDMPMTAPTFGERLSAFGAPPSENIEDRREDAKSGYLAMKALNQRAVHPLRRDLGLDRFDVQLPQPRPPRQSSQLSKDAGIGDIGQRDRVR